MAGTVRIRRTLVIEEASRILQAARPIDLLLGTVIGHGGSRSTIVATAGAFTAIPIPAGAVGIVLEVGACPSLVLKGATGDTGISLTPATPSGESANFPLASGATLGVKNNGGSDQIFDVVIY